MTDKKDNHTEREKSSTDKPFQQEEKPGKLGFLQMLSSSLAAAIGVQSSKNKERDFSQGDAKRFVILGIVMTLVFLLTMLGIVQLVLSL